MFRTSIFSQTALPVMHNYADFDNAYEAYYRLQKKWWAKICEYEEHKR